ncbi:LacI family transcriptional regulator [Enterovibrio norvegicus FF-162]|nr:substrate-binding domain-containing protein [Enterovibrio norvegicus]OEE75029.1 LacI family transcriptional regulator [Enterovibrio norvegicus FF-162]
MVASGDYQVQCEEDALQFLVGKGCQHIVMHSKAMSDDALTAWAKKLPGLVLVNRCVKDIAPQCVWLDNAQGTYLATKHLIEHGHRDIASISCEMALDDKAARFEGYQRALQEVGIAVNPDWVEEVPFGEQSGAIAATNLLNKGLPVTAVVAFNDFFAAAAMQVFREQGVSMPERLSIVGFDDVLPSCYFSPALTTIRSPIESMGMNAARLSLGEQTTAPVREFQPILIKRQSVQRR